MYFELHVQSISLEYPRLRLFTKFYYTMCVVLATDPLTIKLRPYFREKSILTRAMRCSKCSSELWLGDL
jgi:hypothetical protein